MRTREEIENETFEAVRDSRYVETCSVLLAQSSLEVLLDIRELLQKKN